MASAALLTSLKSSSKKLHVHLTSPYAIIPTKGSKKAAGFDLYCAHDCIILAKSHAKINTELAVKPPKFCYGRLALRGSAAARGLVLSGGVIDADYTGPIQMCIFNSSDEDFVIKRGDRIVQYICERIVYPKLVQVSQLEKTDRGDQGFGSSGLNVDDQNSPTTVTAASSSTSASSSSQIEDKKFEEPSSEFKEKMEKFINSDFKQKMEELINSLFEKIEDAE